MILTRAVNNSIVINLGVEYTGPLLPSQSPSVLLRGSHGPWLPSVIPDTCLHIKANTFAYVLHLMKTWTCPPSPSTCVFPQCLGNCSTFTLKELPRPLTACLQSQSVGVSSFALMTSGFQSLAISSYHTVNLTVRTP